MSPKLSGMKLPFIKLTNYVSGVHTETVEHCLLYSVWILSWKTQAGSRKHLEAFAHYLPVDADGWLIPYLVLSARIPTYGLFKLLLDVITALWLASKGEHPSQERMGEGGREPGGNWTLFMM